MTWLGVFGISVFTVLIAMLAVTFGEIPEAEASEPYIGQIMYFGGNFAIRGWATCSGQLLSISSNSALFSILGTTYGGDGRTTFGLPDARGSVLIGEGRGPGLSDYRLGQRGGTETTTLTVGQLPVHNHGLSSAVLQGTNAVGDTLTLADNALALSFARTHSTVAPTTAMHADSIGGTTDNTGSNQSHDNRQPYLTVTCLIALQGIYPSRN